MAYKAELPPDVKLPEGFKIDTNDERYKALEQLATRERWTQKALSDVLGIEARRVSAEHASARAAAPAPAPAPAARAAVPENWGKLSFQEKMLWSQNNPRRG